MYNPFQSYLRTQAVMMTAANAMSTSAFRCWSRGVADASRLWQPAPKQRCQDRHEREQCHVTGPQLTEEYGRRNNDVDVEHL